HVREARLTQVKAAQMLGLTDRQVRRLLGAYERRGTPGVVSSKRSRPSNNAISAEVAVRAMALVRETATRTRADPGGGEAGGGARDGPVARDASKVDVC